MAQLVECLSSTQEALVLLPALYKTDVVYPVIPALGKWRQKDQFKIIPSYTANLRPAWDKWNLVSNNIKTPKTRHFRKLGSGRHYVTL